MLIGHLASRKNENLAKKNKSRLQVQQYRTPAEKMIKQERQPGIRRKIRTSEVITEVTINNVRTRSVQQIRNSVRASSTASYYSYIGVRYLSINIYVSCRAYWSTGVSRGTYSLVVPEVKFRKIAKRRHMYRYVQNTGTYVRTTNSAVPDCDGNLLGPTATQIPNSGIFLFQV